MTKGTEGVSVFVSYRKRFVVPPAITLNGEVAGWHLWPILPFIPLPSPVVLFIRAPGPFAVLRWVAPLPPCSSALHLVHKVIPTSGSWPGPTVSPPRWASSLIPRTPVCNSSSPGLQIRLVPVITQDPPPGRRGVSVFTTVSRETPPRGVCTPTRLAR